MGVQIQSLRQQPLGLHPACKESLQEFHLTERETAAKEAVIGRRQHASMAGDGRREVAWPLSSRAQRGSQHSFRKTKQQNKTDTFPSISSDVLRFWKLCCTREKNYLKRTTHGDSG
ncbi:Hypothetical predicted protein [Marmota monax]|uniref:Uncharacterized protein n=1 Tax=Marmota monax TaxID=9995 RepID=A0A5E4A9S8_MARMO|nr:Hypothetical predicted protein [Marmota monax]